MLAIREMTMSSSDQDRAVLKHIRRRELYSALPYAIAFATVWYLGFTWFEHRFGVSRQVAEAAVFLFLAVLAVPFGPLMRFRRDTSRRHRSLFNDLMNQGLTRYRWIFIVYLVFNIVLTLSGLHHLDRRFASDNSHRLLIVMLVSLLPWQVNLFFQKLSGPVDELVQLEHFRAAAWGFVVLVVLGLAACIGNDARPGTLHITLPAALLASALVAHLSLWVQDRRAGRDADDR